LDVIGYLEENLPPTCVLEVTGDGDFAALEFETMFSTEEMHLLWLKNWVGIEREGDALFEKIDASTCVSFFSFGIVDPKFWSYTAGFYDYDGTKCQDILVFWRADIIKTVRTEGLGFDAKLLFAHHVATE
jgi:hypothetical protein